MILKICLMVLIQFLRIVGNNINDAQLEILFVEQQILMLRVHINQAFTKFLKHRELYGRIVDKGPTLARGCQLTTDNRFVGIVFNIIFREEVFHAVARKVELSLDDAFIGTGLNGLCVCTLA